MAENLSPPILNGRVDEVVDRASAWVHPPLRLLYIACVILGRNDEALEWAEKAVAEDPRSYLCWVELANVQSVLERTDEALESLQKARAIVPTWTLALYDKGTRITFRSKEELVEPQLAGLRKLGIE